MPSSWALCSELRSSLNPGRPVSLLSGSQCVCVSCAWGVTVAGMGLPVCGLLLCDYFVTFSFLDHLPGFSVVPVAFLNKNKISYSS